MCGRGRGVGTGLLQKLPRMFTAQVCWLMGREEMKSILCFTSQDTACKAASTRGGLLPVYIKTPYRLGQQMGTDIC